MQLPGDPRNFTKIHRFNDFFRDYVALLVRLCAADTSIFIQSIVFNQWSPALSAQTIPFLFSFNYLSLLKRQFLFSILCYVVFSVVGLLWCYFVVTRSKK